MSATGKIFIIIIAAVYGTIFICAMMALVFGRTFGVKCFQYREEICGDSIVRHFNKHDTKLSALSEEGKAKSRLRIPTTVTEKK